LFSLIVLDDEEISDENQFYTNPTVISDFKDYISHLITHVNVYNGKALVDDPTILAWETGNEIKPPSNWTQEIAKYHFLFFLLPFNITFLIPLTLVIDISKVLITIIWFWMELFTSEILQEVGEGTILRQPNSALNVECPI
jgi:hypothetical protein